VKWGAASCRRARFASQRAAGLAKIAAGSSSVVVKPVGVDVTSDTKILVTPQSRGGTVQRVSRNAAMDAFQIFLTQPATQTVIVAYFVIS
jgi:hypothetical protein